MRLSPETAQIATGSLLAWTTAGVTVLYDCHVSIQDRLKRVPIPIFRAPQALTFAFVCGVVAAIAFLFTDGKGDTIVDSVLGLKQPNPFLRGLIVGLTVLVLIRSKLSSVRGAEIGGELIYNTGRVWVMQSVNQNWRDFKSAFNLKNLNHALTMPDYEGNLLEELRPAIRIQSEDYRTYVETQISNVVRSRPQTRLDSQLPEWQAYFKTLTSLALDYAGPEVFSGWTQFS